MMFWGLYVWPRYNWTLAERRRAVARRLRDLAAPVLRVPRWMSDATNAVATSSALLFELFRSGR
jgi:hypothetical protein